MSDHDPIAFAEKLAYWRANGLQLAPSATPSRYRAGNPAKANPVWERGVVTEQRADGSQMPMIDANTGNPIRVKQYAENRQGYDAQRRRLASDPTVLASERARS